MIYNESTPRSPERRPSAPVAVALAAAALAAAFAASSCVSSPEPEPDPAASAPVAAAQAAPAAAAATGTAPERTPWSLPGEPVSAWTMPSAPSAFMRANLPTIETRTLANGVTLIVKKNPANRVFSMKIAFRGGSAMTGPERAGIEAMTLAMLARGSTAYPYAALQRAQYERSSSIGYSASSYDWASFDLNTIDKYWDEMFAIYADCALSPAFDPAQFAVVQNDFKVSIQKSLADPYNFAVTRLHGKMFAGHPYAAEFGGSAESVAAITLDDVKAYYRDAMSADRMVVVAVGNFDADALAASLNATVGSMPRKGIAVPAVERFEPKEALYLERFDKSKGVAYVRGDFPIADPRSPDFPTLQLAFSMLDELLFSIVRTDHGACYSVWSKAFGFESAYGSLVVYKTDRPGEAKGWVDEAIALLASGKTLNVKGGDEKYAPIASTIEAYKAKYINSFFGSQQTNAETAAQLVAGSVYFGDHLEYLRFIDKVNAIRPEDVVAAIKAYVVDAPVSWIVVADQGTLSKVDATRFERFTGTVE
ncbi:MAG: insulinase family protein [Spirochaetes bacterium]|nr:insulinase family protein [Spirochaetota bacterium]MBU1080224.1 insulinase family protein [Spirochaetota bacterium]